MRQIATLPEDAAQTFADYLLTLKIETQLQPEADGTAVWVRDEDRVPQAREELAAFTRNPSDPRYRAASPVADALRRQEARAEEAYTRRLRRFDARMRGLSPIHRPVTITLVAISLIVALASGFGKEGSPILQYLHISSYRIEDGMVVWPYLKEIRSGEVWRLVTPIFIHIGPLHLIFNMLMLLSLGGQVEARRGSIRLLLLVLVLAVASNLAEYYLGRSVFENGRLILKGWPLFGGMSGVLYGLFGYMWMKGRFEPRSGLQLSKETVVVMLVWFFLCLVGIIPNVANAAHAGGLLLGLLLGYGPTLWRRLRGNHPLDV
jgi:GlpG protein